jgi:hypothetical protein
MQPLDRRQVPPIDRLQGDQRTTLASRLDSTIAELEKALREARTLRTSLRAAEPTKRQLNTAVDRSRALLSWPSAALEKWSEAAGDITRDIK